MGEKTQKCMKGNSPQIYLYVQWKVIKIPTGIFVEIEKTTVKFRISQNTEIKISKIAKMTLK